MKKLFRYLKPYRALAIISPLLMVGEVLADLCLPFLMSYIVDFGILEGGLTDIRGSGFAEWIMTLVWGESFTQLQIILTFGVLMLLITLIGGFFGTLCAYTAARAAQSFGNDLRRDAYRRVMSLSIEQTDRFTTGSLVTRMTNDIAMILEFVEMLLRMFVRSPMFLLGGTVMLLSLQVSYGLVLLCALPVLLLSLTLVLSKAIPMYAEVQKRLDRVNTVVQENVTGARVVKAYVCEDYEFDRFSEANGALRSVNYRVLRLMAVIPPILTVVQNLSVIAVILIGGNRIQANLDGMTVGTVMAAVTYVTQVVSSIMMVTMVFQSISRAAASAKRVNEVLETEPVIRSGNATADSAPIAVSLKNVSFRYPGTKGEPVLRDIDLEIRKGETLAIVGATGCGKTTLAGLIPRFYDATEGEVSVNGLSIRDHDLSALRGKIGYVMQKSELFSDTVAGNLRWGKPDATEEELYDAARAAQAYDFVSSMPEGFESFIAEKGASLSGGQKQRLSIARALVRRPEILILDDSTSALDLATEAKLRAAMRERLTDTTVILIAQRIASVKHADRIAVMENGTVVACDTHESLMQSCPTYIEICQSQLRANDAEGGGAR